MVDLHVHLLPGLDDGPSSLEEAVELARAQYRPNQTLNFYVDPSQGHDDFLMSLALLVEASRYLPRVARGRATGEGEAAPYPGFGADGLKGPLRPAYRGRKTQQ